MKKISGFPIRFVPARLTTEPATVQPSVRSWEERVLELAQPDMESAAFVSFIH